MNIRYTMFAKTLALVILVAGGLVGCMPDDINTNVYGVTEEENNAGGRTVGSPLMTIMQDIIPIGTPDQTTGPGNDLQATDLISSGNYIGFFGNNNNWGGNIESNWNFPDNRMEYIQRLLYSDPFKAWNEAYQAIGKSDKPTDQQMFAVMEVLKVMAWTRATDAFGPIVYSQAGDGDIEPKPDSQEVVYKSMLADLEKASKILNATPTKVLEKFDLVYNGDAAKWTRLANSIMLRLAVRTHFVAPELAKEYVAKALDPANGGVIESISDEAVLKSSNKITLLNPMLASIDYGETRMGATIWSYLDGYQDPRISKYFKEGSFRGNSGYYAIPNTYDQSKRDANSGSNSPFFASIPNVETSTGVYWLRASEVAFLKAEAALFGLCGGSPKDYYERGVQLSFEENGASGAEDYLASTKSATDIGPMNNYYVTSYMYISNISEDNVSPAWDHLSTTKSEQEEHLQKIITQKYLALYPNAIEAWTEYRRTGYPYIHRPVDRNAQSRIEGRGLLAPERFKFPSTAYSTNKNMSIVPELLGGPDIGSTRLWWVRPDRPVQK